MLDDLPVETVEYRLSEEEQACPECSRHLHEMSKEIRKELILRLQNTKKFLENGSSLKVSWIIMKTAAEQ